MHAREEPSGRWWEEEPWLVFETSPMMHIDTSLGENWQEWADPSVEVDVIKASGALQTHGLSFFLGMPLTEQGCYFKSTRIKNRERDYLAEFLAKSKEAGFRTVVYFNVHAIREDFADAFPEWGQIRSDGTRVSGLYGNQASMCVNTGFRDWVRDVCLDLCAYPIDGIFFDGPCLYTDCCYCESCRTLYRDRFGREIPPKKPGHPDLKALAEFQADSLGLFLKHSNDAVKSVRPDVALYCNAGSRDEPSYAAGRNNRVLIRHQDVLAAEGGFVYGELSPQPMWRVGSNAKYYQTQADGKPTGVFISQAHGPWRSAYRPEAEIRLEMAQAPIHGSGVWLSSFVWFKDQPAMKGIAEDFNFFSDNREAYFRTVSKARVAIVWPDDSLNFYGKPTVLHGDFTQGGQSGETVGDIHDEFNGFYDALLKAHVPCDIIDEESMRRGEIGRYDLLVLPNVGCTGDAVDGALRDYVRGGGNVIASFETSICDENGKRGDTFRLADLFGVRLLRTPLQPFPNYYFFPQQAYPEFFKDITAPLLPAPPISCEGEPAGSETVTPYSLKLPGWSDAPIVPSEFPAITRNSFGAGVAIYMAGAFGGLFWRYKQMEIRLVLRNLFHQLASREVVLRNVPTSVEVAHRESNDGLREMVHLINYGGGGTRPIEHIESRTDLCVRLRTARTRVSALRLACQLPLRREGEWAEIVLPKLDLSETLVFEGPTQAR